MGLIWETWDVVKKTPRWLRRAPRKLAGITRRLANAIQSTGRQLFGVFKDSAYVVQDLITGNAPERVGPIKRTGNIIKSRAKIPLGDVRKTVQDDFAHEKTKYKELADRRWDALNAVTSLPAKTLKIIKQKAEDLASLFLWSGKPAAIS